MAPAPSATNVLLTISISFLLYSIGLTVYRLFFHPLAKFPGPKLAAATRWYEFYHDIIIQGRYVWHIEKLHEKYGPILRISPDEIVIHDPEFYEEAYGSAVKKRDRWSVWVAATGSLSGILGTIDHDHHRLRRSAINPFFSKQNAVKRVPQIKQLLTRFMERLDRCKANSEIIRLEVAFGALTMDIIETFAFGQDHEHVLKPDFNIAFRDAMVGTVTGAAFLRQFPWIYHVAKALPLRVVQALMPDVGGMMVWLAMVRRDIDRIISLNKDGKRAEGTIFQTLLDSDLGPQEKTPQRLEDEANIIVGAGTETTSRCLVIMTFFMSQDRTILKKLRDELSTLKLGDDGFYNLNDLEKLPYLTACITEGMRMQCGVLGRMPRISRTPVQYQQWTIPPGYPFSVNNYIVNYDPVIFPEPLQYRPERWIEAAKNNVRLDKYMVSFGRGTRQCIGINLAWVELYLSLPHLIMKYDFEFYDTTAERDVHIDRDCFIPCPKIESNGIRARVVDAY